MLYFETPINYKLAGEKKKPPLESHF